MAGQPGQHVMAVLPNRLADHQRSVRRDAAEYRIAVLLAIDETMTARLIVGVRAFDLAAFAADGLHDRLLRLVLGRPALAVGGRP
jgi:hypothetical protein